MNTFNSYRLLITPLSPVHIGTGESYEPTNYVIEDGVLYEFDTGTAMRALTEADRAELLTIGNRRPDAGMIEAMQRFFHERRGPLMAQAMQRVPVLPGVANLYALRIGKTANREAGGKAVVNRLEIDRTGYALGTRLPILFGSSVKGAIRTALLDEANGGKPAQERKGLHEFQGRLFKYRDPERGRLFLERDPLRLVRLNDANWVGESGLPAAQIFLAVNRKKATAKDKSGNVRKSQAEGKDLYQILECASAYRYRAFYGQLTVQTVDDLGARQSDNLPAADLRFDLHRIARACNDFYKPILEAEMQLLRSRDYLDDAWGKAIDRLLMASDRKLQQGQAFLLRVGRHSGAESVTLNGVRSIKIMEGKGSDGKNKSSNADGAKTLWLAAEDKDQQRNLLPFGWLLVEVHPMNGDIPEWPELKTACEPYQAEARRLADILTARAAEIEQARREAEINRLAEDEKKLRQEEERRRQVQVEAERQAQRQAELAALNPIERGIEEFLDQRPDKNQPEISAVIGAVKQGHWQGEEKIAVAAWLQARMQASKGQWKESSQAKKPEKDREYQNTLLVRSWLDGK